MKAFSCCFDGTTKRTTGLDFRKDSCSMIYKSAADVDSLHIASSGRSNEMPLASAFVRPIGWDSMRSCFSSRHVWTTVFQIKIPDGLQEVTSSWFCSVVCNSLQ